MSDDHLSNPRFVAAHFTYAHYRAILARATERYSFLTFDQAAALGHGPAFDAATVGKGHFILRHDIDFSPARALAMARIEAEVGVVATYFFQPNAHYNLLGGPDCVDVLGIVALGHRIGLHFDRAFYLAHGMTPATAIARDAALLGRRFDTEVTVVAEHKPGRDPAWRPLVGLGLLDAYDPRFARDIDYVSDSCQFWRTGCLCKIVERAETRSLQALIHPIWWSEGGLPADQALREHTLERIERARAAEREEFLHYASLSHLGNRLLFEKASSWPGAS
jgi:hypothetical protein